MQIFSDPIGIALGGLLLLALLVAAGVLLERRQRLKWQRFQHVLQQTQADLAAAESALRAAKSAGRNRSMSAPAFGSLGT